MPDLIDGKRCKGHCCRRFTLPFGPEELREHAAAWCRGESHNGHRFSSEVLQVAGMVVHLGEDDLDTNRRRRKSGRRSHWYTCGHHDPVSGDCLIYSIRPPMCREYPEYGGGYPAECLFDACAAKPFLRRFPLTRPLWRWWNARRVARKMKLDEVEVLKAKVDEAALAEKKTAA